MEEVSRYLAGEHTENADHIAHCPACQDAIHSLRRLQALTAELITEDTRRAADASWFHRLMSGLDLEGRRHQQ